MPLVIEQGLILLHLYITDKLEKYFPPLLLIEPIITRISNFVFPRRWNSPAPWWTGRRPRCWATCRRTYWKKSSKTFF